MFCMSQRSIWALNAGEESGAKLPQTINTTLFCSVKQGPSVKKRVEEGEEGKLVAVFLSGWTRATDVG